MPFMFIGLNHTSSKHCIGEKGVPYVSMIEFCFWSHHDVSSIIDLISVKWAPEHPHVRIWKNHFMINTTVLVRWGQFDTNSYILIQILCLYINQPISVYHCKMCIFNKLYHLWFQDNLHIVRWYMGHYL